METESAGGSGALMLSGRSVLVTGGAGFIGSHLVEYLVRGGARVTVIDDLSRGDAGSLAAVNGGFEMLTAELGAALRSGVLVPARYDFIFHLAANAYIPPSVEDPAYDYRTNLENTFLLLEALRTTRAETRVVNVSTAGVYGDPARVPIHEDDPTVPISPYGVGKLAAERYAAVFAQLYGLRVNSLRFFSVFGPRQRKQVVFDFLRKLKTSPAELEVLGDGRHERDFVFVTDVVQALLLAATQAPGRGEVYNVASGRTITIGDLAHAVCRMRSPGARLRFTGRDRPGDAKRWVVDISRLRGLGFEPRVSLEAGLELVAEWFDGLIDAHSSV